jgi:DnaJ-class molecular chaperone
MSDSKADDPYATLGVPRTATQADVSKAFRKLAKTYHPDLNPGDKDAEARFKAISAANEILSDPDKRARYDRGEIDASGQERPERGFYRSYAESGGAGGKYNAEDMQDLGDLFGELFGRGRPGGGTLRMRGADRHYTLAIDFLGAVTGETQRINLPDGGTLDVKVPPGVESGQVLRLRGKGEPGLNGGPDGDALIELHVLNHPHFRREGRDIHLDLPVSLREATLGARVRVRTPVGAVMMSVPARSDTGRQLRLRGRGVAAHGHDPAGDLLLTLSIVIGPPDPGLEDYLKSNQGPSFDPRAELEKTS